MKSKHLLLSFLFLLFWSFTMSAQDQIEDLVEEGIAYHDKGEFAQAIETYKKALSIDPNSTLVNYEIAFSHFCKGDYEEAIKYSDNVLIQEKGNMLEAYTTKGSALDMLGKTKESIELFEKAIKKMNGHYLLFYNLGLNYYKTNDLDKAEVNVINAIEHNPNHSSSHLMLANIQNQKGNAVPTLLATHYFLFLEPDSKRSIQALDMLYKNFGGNVTKDPNKPNTINILVSNNDNSPFGTAELMISMLEASKSLEENKEKTEDEMFVENTESFFKVLGEMKKKRNKEIWWTFYVTFFYDLAKSDHIETYCKYITQSNNEDSQKWLTDHESKLIEFDSWLKSN